MLEPCPEKNPLWHLWQYEVSDRPYKRKYRLYGFSVLNLKSLNTYVFELIEIHCARLKVFFESDHFFFLHFYKWRSMEGFKAVTYYAASSHCSNAVIHMIVLKYNKSCHTGTNLEILEICGRGWQHKVYLIFGCCGGVIGHRKGTQRLLSWVSSS